MWVNSMQAAVVLLAGAAAYLLVFAFYGAAHSPRSSRQRIRKLIHMQDIADFSAGAGSDKNADAGSRFSFIKVSETLRRYLMGSGIRVKPDEFIVLWFVSAFLLPLLGMVLFSSHTLTVLMGILGFALPPLLVRSARAKRIKLFGNQLNEALLIIGNALRAGFTFRHALARVAEDLPDPISQEFRRVVREVNYGMSIDESLAGVAERMQSRELDMVNSAVIIQQRTGGNLAEIIEKVSITISDRIKIKNAVRVLTAQGRISGWIIGGLPVFLLVYLSLSAPDYVSVFFTTGLGRMALLLAAVLEIIGFFIISRLVDIKY